MEPESELVKVDKVRLEGVIAMLEVLMPQADPANKARLIEWAANITNDSKHLFASPIVLDYEELANYVPAQPSAEPGEPRIHDI